MDQSFVIGAVDTVLGKIPRVASVLKWEDRFGAIKARWGINRMDYKVDPGLYALGNPNPQSPVFVTANYKMSFDALREALGNLASWILVLDTKGINVWCAAAVINSALGRKNAACCCVAETKDFSSDPEKKKGSCC